MNIAIKKIYIEHNGCLNFVMDYNILVYALQKEGAVFCKDSETADIIVFAGCGVRSAWVTNAIERINKFSITNKTIIITGCIANIETDRIKQSIRSNDLQFLTFQDFVSKYTSSDFDELAKELSQNETTNLVGNNPLRNKLGNKLKILNYLRNLDVKYKTQSEFIYRKYTSGFSFYNELEPIEYIVAARGCPYKCSYCTIPRGRGNFSSVPMDNILSKVHTAIANKRYKIIVIGDELGNYGCDMSNGTTFKILLDNILSIDKRITLSLRYIEPIPFLHFYDVISQYCHQGRISLIHLPIQTGSQKILHDMNRNYDIDNLFLKCKVLRDNTNTIFCTNWLIGFPTETHKDFALTLQIAKKLKFHLNTVIPFSPRPDTPAYFLKPINTEVEIREHCKILERELLNEKYITLCEELYMALENEKSDLWQMMLDNENIPINNL